MKKDHVATTETREWKARERLEAAIASRVHLTAMVTFWTGKLAEIQARLAETQANLQKVTALEQDLRSVGVPQAVATDRNTRKQELLERMAKMKAEMARLEEQEL